MLVDARALDEGGLDLGRDAEHGEREERLAAERHRQSAEDGGGAVLGVDARQRAEQRGAEALLLDHRELPQRAREAGDQPAEERAAHLRLGWGRAGAGKHLLELAGGAELHAGRAAEVQAGHYQPSVDNLWVERDRETLLHGVLPGQQWVICELR